MSIKVYGNVPKKQLDTINSTAHVTEVPVEINSYKNRKTNASTLKSYLKARGGKFDRGLWQPPLVAELPDKTRFLFDGDHRRALWRWAFPKQETMPAQIVPVKSRSEISRLFVAINKTARKALSANEVFVHEVLGGDEEAGKIAKHLEDCQLKVSLGTGEPGSHAGDIKGPEVSIGGFKQAIKESNATAVRRSSETIQSLWKNDTVIGIEFLRGLASVYKHTPAYEKHKTYLEDFISSRKSADITQKEVSASFKQEGGNINHKIETCVTLGLLTKFKRWSIANKYISKSTFNRDYGSYIKNLKAELVN